MSRSAVRLGIVGFGMVAERGHLPALAGMDAIRPVAIAEPVPERRRLAAGLAGYPDLAAMLVAEELEAVLICSPPALHLEHAEMCAAAGLPTLVEKPPGLEVGQASRLAALRPEPMIGFNRRFARGLPVGRRRPEHPTRVTAIFDAPPGDWQREGPAVDPLLDLGCHLVDLTCWITATHPARGRAIAAPSGRVSFELEMTDGLRLHAECGAALHYRELMDVRTEQGRAQLWRWPLTAPRDAAARLLRRPPPLIGSWRAQLQAFANLVRGEDAGRLARAREGLQVMAALEAVQVSLAGSRDWITVSADPTPAAAPAG